MHSRRIKRHTGFANPERPISYAPTIERGATMGSTTLKTLSAGMSTKNFITQILDIFATLDRDRKQQLVNYSGQLAAEQRAEQRGGGAMDDDDVRAFHGGLAHRAR